MAVPGTRIRGPSGPSNDPAHPDPAGYKAENRHNLQLGYRNQLRKEGHSYNHIAADDTELEDKIQKDSQRWGAVAKGLLG